RGLAPPALLVFLILGWTVLPGSPWLWTAAALAVVAWPLLLQLTSIPSRIVRFALGGVRESFVPAGVGNTAAQVLLAAAFLPEQAGLLLDAISRTLYRVFVGKRRMLEWETAAAAERRLGGDFRTFLRVLWLSPVLGLALALILFTFRLNALTAAAPLLIAWLVSPFVAFWVSKPPPVEERELTDPERRLLRRLARKTWGFFETFVTEEDNWLPPDNYQEDPKAAVAHRTSPTNMGLYLISSLAGHDFGYLSFPALLGLLEKTFATFDRLERAHGHFYNWYETTTLKALPPIYLSTVDSGNLLGCFVTLKQGLREKAAELIPNSAIRDGFEDVLELATEALQSLEPAAESADSLAALAGRIQQVRSLLGESPADLLAWDDWLRRLDGEAAGLTEQAEKFAKEVGEAPAELQRWVERFASLVRERREELAGLAPWLELLREVPASIVPQMNGKDDPVAANWQGLRRLLTQPLSVTTLLARAESLRTDLAALAEVWPDAEGRSRLTRVAEAVGDSTASDLHMRWRSLAERAETFANEMDFKILYSEDRHLFAVGYNLSQGKLDSSHYDLLASESCLTSFLAVARGDVPKKHWFQLGRPLTRAAGRITLLSWGGTMFEYLMPRLMLPGLPETLLDESRRGAVARQIEYGRQCGTPWGVSESAFSVVDADLNYQYQAFGVPGLGLKRGLAKDLVVAPYAAVMAVMIQPRLAIRNFQRL
ncbi:MAG TPA: glycosyl transferase family 36, partial [Planctomycetales bacterium]|nr:glycosyl transferase family 36 [Planctomycetales bacterium]